MNDTRPSQPSRPQPVSMHDTPHKHHGALPLVTAMLGVLLVLETIVFGYVITQYVDVQNQQEEILDKRAEVVAARLNAPVITPGKECSDTLLSNLVFNPPARPFAWEGSSTWLRDKVGEFEGTDSCVTVEDNDLTKPETLQALGEANTDASIKNLLKILELDGSKLYKICTGTDDTYAVMVSSKGRTATVAAYDTENSAWQSSQPVTSVIDYSIHVYADFFGTGTPLITTGYGDAGRVSWRYWVPTDSGATQQLESCVAGGGLEGYTDTEQMMICELEYAP